MVVGGWSAGQHADAQLFDTLRREIPRLTRQQVRARLSALLGSDSVHKNWAERDSWDPAEIDYLRPFAESDRTFPPSPPLAFRCTATRD